MAASDYYGKRVIIDGRDCVISPYDPTHVVELTAEETNAPSFEVLFHEGNRMADDEADVNDANRQTIKAELVYDHRSVFADSYAAERQQGREEVLREIAAMKVKYFGGPDGCDAYCRFCDADIEFSDGKHELTCLWLRASKVGK